MTSTRSLLAGVAAVIALTAAGCSDDPEPSPTDIAATPTETPAADPTAAVTDLYHRYLDAVVTAEADLITDRGHFAGIMTRDAAQIEVDFVKNLAENKLFRSGEPVVADEVTVNVEGDEGTAEACVDPAQWIVGSTDGSVVEQPYPPGPHPFVVRVQRQDDGTWLVSETLYDQESTITC